MPILALLWAWELKEGWREDRQIDRLMLVRVHAYSYVRSFWA
jgi:hypothetical protein